MEVGGRAAFERADLLTEAGIERALREASGPSGRGRTARLQVGDAILVVRPYRRGGLLGPWLGQTLWGGERPLAELRVHAELWRRGAAVPRPAFAVAWRRAGPLWSGAYATHEARDCRDAVAYLSTSPAAAPLRRALVAVGATLRRFHDLGGVHPDLNLRNVLIGPGADAPRVVFVDLDRARLADPVSPRRRMRELMRLFRSAYKEGLHHRIGTRGAALVFRSYWAGDRGLRRALLEHLPAERRRVRRHALLYRGG